MRKIYFLFAVIHAGVFMAQSPISIGNSNMPGSGDTLRYSNVQLNSLGNYTQTGINYSWNFNYSPTSQGVRSFKSSLLTPYAFFFLALNEYGEKIADTVGAGPITLTNYYNYYKKQSTPVNAFIADGVGLTFSMVPVPSYYSDKDELYNFPMSYPKYDSTTFKFSTSTNTAIPIRYSKTGYRVTVVDGWGTITTPYGTAPCLRLITTQYSMDSIKNNIVPIPVGFSNNQRSYQWMTTGSKIPFLEITGNLVGANFTPTQARYRDIPRVITGIKEEQDISAMSLYPNPAKETLNVRWSGEKGSGSLTAQVFDQLGKLMGEQFIEPDINGNATINVIDLTPGLYVIKLKQAANSYCFKFIKE